MNAPEPAAVTRFKEAHSAVGGGGRVVILPDTVHTALLAAEALGCEVGAIANSLLFDADGAPLLKIEVGMSLAEIERVVTLATLEHFGRHKERTAAALGVSLKTLYNRLKEYSTVPSRSDADSAGEDSSFGSLR